MRLILSVLAAALTAACVDDPSTIPPEPAATSPLTEGHDLVAIGRDVVRKSAHDDDFYLAIRRSVLAERWFLSGVLRQSFPEYSAGHPAASLGTRVVSFKVQNDKLFLFDADDRGTAGGGLATDRLIEAYPIVDDPRLRRLAGAGDYVIFDPAAGLNRFSFVSDTIATEEGWNRWDGGPAQFTVDLSFLQGFQRLRDGIFYQQVFTGHADTPAPDRENDPEPNPFLASGTMGISLRRYREGPGYTPGPMPDREYFFRLHHRLDPETWLPSGPTTRLNVHPGMAPVEWLIDPELARLDDTPAYADVDLVGIIEGGIEGWNAAFGFRVLTARVARPDESFDRDDVNTIVFDPSPSGGHGYASTRLNPNTGEVRGGTIYLPEVFIRRSRFEDQPAPIAAAPRAVPGLRWSGAVGGPLCVQTIDAVAPTPSLTPAQRLTGYLGNTIAHEIGHQLGLRHNFKGSLVPPSSSVMEYSTWDDRIAVGGTPGSYDIAAIRYLYGLSTEPPTDPFCTDNPDGQFDADCQARDTGADPLSTMYTPPWLAVREGFLDGTLGEWDSYLISRDGKHVARYAVFGDADQGPRAADLLFAGAEVPVDPARLAANPDYGPGADLLLRLLLRNEELRVGPYLFPRFRDQVQRVMVNEDGVRSYHSRRELVPILKEWQSLAAWRVLIDARAVVVSELAADRLPPDEVLYARDLIAVIDRATSPYFDR